MVREKAKPVVLVAVEPRTYRTVVGKRLSASVVVSSLPPPSADERDGTAWARVIFPAEPGTWVALGDDPLVDRPDFDLEDLLGLVDGLAGTP